MVIVVVVFLSSALKNVDMSHDLTRLSFSPTNTDKIESNVSKHGT